MQTCLWYNRGLEGTLSLFPFPIAYPTQTTPFDNNLDNNQVLVAALRVAQPIDLCTQRNTFFALRVVLFAKGYAPQRRRSNSISLGT
jgi:hypothetical protein